RDDARGRGGVRRDRGRCAPGRDHHGLEERQAQAAARRGGAPGPRHPLRGPGPECPPRSRGDQRVLHERADARVEGDHRRGRDVGGASRLRRLQDRPAGGRRADLGQEPRWPRRAAVGRPDATRRAGRVRRDRRRRERGPARRPDHQRVVQNRRVIPRYTREEIGAVWTQQRRMETWLQVELAATEAWASEGVVPKEAVEAARERAAFTVEAVEERERTTGRDVAAFVDVASASLGEEGRWLHYGLTSSDVLDTALALQLRGAGEIIVRGARAYRDALVERARELAETLCV